MAENKLTQQNRTDREQESRETTARPTSWKRASLLPDPKPQEGWAFRYIRIEFGGQTDNRNIASQLSEGWEPVRAADHPEINFYSDGTGRWADNIIIGGLLLCKTPVEFVQQRNAFFQKQADAQNQSVNQSYLAQSDPRMRKFAENSSQVKSSGI